MAGLPDFDTTVASPARVWNYWLGGKDHFAADREASEKVVAAYPSLPQIARATRRFLVDAVTLLTDTYGVRQFLDIGTGLPTADNTHEVAQRLAPESRIVYVDFDPSVLRHAQALLTSTPEGRTDYIQADLRDVETILSAAARTLDFSKPVAVLVIAVLHFIPDSDNPAGILATLLDALPSGSYFVSSHVSAEHNPAMIGAAVRAYHEGGLPAQARDSDEFARLAFAGLELVPPGVVIASEWRPEGDRLRPSPEEVNGYGGVARKP